MNRLPGRIGDNGDVQVLGQRLTVLNPNGQTPGEAVDALLRPEALEIVPDSAGAGTVTDRTFLGSVGAAGGDAGRPVRRCSSNRPA